MMVNRPLEETEPSILDRTVNLEAIGWSTLTWIGVIVVAFALRLGQLGHFALSPDSSSHAYNAWIFYRGASADPGQTIPNTEPVLLILQSFSYFLFGTTDITARLFPALFGGTLVVLIFGLRSFVGNTTALGMAALAAISPTLVYTSRIGDPQILVAFFTLLLIVAFLHIGQSRHELGIQRGWAVVFGTAAALMLGSSPTSLTVFIALISGLIVGLASSHSTNPLRHSLVVLLKTPSILIFALLSFFITLFTVFSRLFSDLSALVGIGETFSGWARFMTTSTSTTPTQFFILALLLYEIVAVVFAIVMIGRSNGTVTGQLSWPFFATWFIVVLVLFSFSSGRAPEDTVHSALPLVLLGGGAIGNLIAELHRKSLLHGNGGWLLLSLIGLVITVVSWVILIGRISSARDEARAIVEVLAVGIAIILPLIVISIFLMRNLNQMYHRRYAGLIALLTLLIFLGAFTLRSSIQLSFYNANTAVEPLAQQRSTAAVDPLITRLMHLSRDATVNEATIRNPTGGKGLSIAIDKRVEFPYRWYFREFPDATVVAAGQAALSGAEIVIAPDNTGMPEAGYTATTYYTLNRVPGSYLTPHIGNIFRGIVLPSNWERSARFLLYREITTNAQPASIAVGLDSNLAARVFPNSGPFNLFERAGAGNGRGQFNDPRGIAVSPVDDNVYVVDMGNARIERFDETGKFINIIGDAESDVSFTRTQSGLGPTGITVGADGLVYVTDTWAHRVVVFSQDGKLVREFGSFGDTQDSPTATEDPGLFFGPRAIAVTADSIYVVDTGNERIQVFAKDGTFQSAWGGYGSEPGQFIEPVGIAIGSDNFVYVADSGNARISVFTLSGAPVTQLPVAAWQGRQFYEPYLAFGWDSYLYATSSQTGSIEVLTTNGELVRSITQINTEILQAPIGISGSPDGSILVTDSSRNAVFRYEPPPPIELPENPIASPVASPHASPIATPIPTES